MSVERERESNGAISQQIKKNRGEKMYRFGSGIRHCNGSVPCWGDACA